MNTATELRNEAREALGKALKAREEGKQEEFDGYWAEYKEKIDAAWRADADILTSR